MKRFAIGVLILAFFLDSRGVYAQEVRTAIISDLRGAVEVKMHGEDWKPAEEGMVLHEKDEIRTLQDGFSKLLLDEEAGTGKLELKENSLLRLNTMQIDAAGEKTTYLDLALGKVLVHAEKLNADSKFEVRTPTTTTGVRGTVFEVEVEKSE